MTAVQICGLDTHCLNKTIKAPLHRRGVWGEVKIKTLTMLPGFKLLLGNY